METEKMSQEQVEKVAEQEAKEIIESFPPAKVFLDHIEDAFNSSGSHAHMIFGFVDKPGGKSPQIYMFTPYSLKDEEAKDQLARSIKCFCIVHRPLALLQINEMWRWLPKE